MEKERFAFLIGGTHSGCGKTTIALALMAAFKARGMRVQPFKVGPDFIDPGFHTQITGVESRNLDGWMLERGYNQELFRRLLGRADMAIVEGVMGLFDGYDGLTESGSSAEMAKWLGLPVILVVDARSMARSAAALVYGFRHFDPGLRFAGVIFNRIGGEGHLEYLKEAMAATLPEVEVLGGIPREDPIRIPERHLGLVTADEIFIDEEWEQNLAGLVERYVDLDLILRVAGWQERSEEGSEKGRGEAEKDWIPAFAGMTMGGSARVTGEAIPGMTEEEDRAGSGHSHPHPDPPPSRETGMSGGIPRREGGKDGFRLRWRGMRRFVFIIRTILICCARPGRSFISLLRWPARAFPRMLRGSISAVAIRKSMPRTWLPTKNSWRPSGLRLPAACRFMRNAGG